MSILRRVSAVVPDADVLREAAAVLTAGGIVAYPTDTFYGLAVDPRDGIAVRRLFAAKGRASQAAVPLIAADADQVEAHVGELSAMARRLAEALWPGPLTLVIPAGPGLAPELLGGGGTVAVRVPAHAVAVGLARAAGHLITSTSANRSGEQPAREAAEVVAAMGDRVALVLDAGVCAGGLPSTVVDVTAGVPRLVRTGAVPWNRVLRSLEA